MFKKNETGSDLPKGMTHCKTCGAVIAKSAKRCPHCGAKNKKPFFKRISFYLIILVVIAVAMSMGGGSTDSSEPTTTKSAASTKQEEKVYAVGDKLTVGKVQYKVTDVSTSSKVGDKYVNTEAQGKFIIISLQITNKGDEALTVSDSFFKILNGEKTYETSTEAAIYLKDSILFKSINPDVSLKGKIVFDVPEKIASSKDNQLQVQTGVWGTEKGLIALK